MATYIIQIWNPQNKQKNTSFDEYIEQFCKIIFINFKQKYLLQYGKRRKYAT